MAVVAHILLLHIIGGVCRVTQHSLQEVDVRLVIALGIRIRSGLRPVPVGAIDPCVGEPLFGALQRSVPVITPLRRAGAQVAEQLTECGGRQRCVFANGYVDQ